MVLLLANAYTKVLGLKARSTVRHGASSFYLSFLALAFRRFLDLRVCFIYWRLYCLEDMHLIEVLFTT